MSSGCTKPLARSLAWPGFVLEELAILPRWQVNTWSIQVTLCFVVMLLADLAAAAAPAAAVPLILLPIVAYRALSLVLDASSLICRCPAGASPPRLAYAFGSFFLPRLLRVIDHASCLLVLVIALFVWVTMALVGMTHSQPWPYSTCLFPMWLATAVQVALLILVAISTCCCGGMMAAPDPLAGRRRGQRSHSARMALVFGDRVALLALNALTIPLAFALEGSMDWAAFFIPALALAGAVAAMLGGACISALAHPLLLPRSERLGSGTYVGRMKQRAACMGVGVVLALSLCTVWLLLQMWETVALPAETDSSSRTSRVGVLLVPAFLLAIAMIAACIVFARNALLPWRGAVFAAAGLATPDAQERAREAAEDARRAEEEAREEAQRQAIASRPRLPPPSRLVKLAYHRYRRVAPTDDVEALSRQAPPPPQTPRMSMSMSMDMGTGMPLVHDASECRALGRDGQVPLGAQTVAAAGVSLSGGNALAAAQAASASAAVDRSTTSGLCMCTCSPRSRSRSSRAGQLLPRSTRHNRGRSVLVSRAPSIMMTAHSTAVPSAAAAVGGAGAGSGGTVTAQPAVATGAPKYAGHGRQGSYRRRSFSHPGPRRQLQRSLQLGRDGYHGEGEGDAGGLAESAESEICPECGHLVPPHVQLQLQQLQRHSRRASLRTELLRRRLGAPILEHKLMLDASGEAVAAAAAAMGGGAMSAALPGAAISGVEAAVSGDSSSGSVSHSSSDTSTSAAGGYASGSSSNATTSGSGTGGSASSSSSSGAGGSSSSSSTTGGSSSSAARSDAPLLPTAGTTASTAASATAAPLPAAAPVGSTGFAGRRRRARPRSLSLPTSPVLAAAARQAAADAADLTSFQPAAAGGAGAAGGRLASANKAAATIAAAASAGGVASTGYIGAGMHQSQSPEADDVDVCHICFVNEADAVALECGHGGLCFQCGIRIKTDTMAMARDGARCPTCRHPMDYLLRIPPPRLHTSALIRCLLDSDEERAASTLAASAAAHRVGRSFMLDSVPRGSGANSHRRGTSMAGIVIAGPGTGDSGNGQGRARGRGFHRARSSLGSALALIAEDDHHDGDRHGDERASAAVAAHASGTVTAPPELQNASSSAASTAVTDGRGSTPLAAAGASHHRHGSSGDASASFLAAATDAQPNTASAMAARKQPQPQPHPSVQPGARVPSERNSAAPSVDTRQPFSRAAAGDSDALKDGSRNGLPVLRPGGISSASALALDAIGEVLSPSGLRRRAVPASATSQQGLLASAATTTTAAGSPAARSPLAAAIAMPERVVTRSPAAASVRAATRAPPSQAPLVASPRSALISPAAHARASAISRSAGSDGSAAGGAASDPADIAERGQLLQTVVRSPRAP